MGVRASLHTRLVEPGETFHEAFAKSLEGYALVVIEGVGGGDADEVEAHLQGVVLHQFLKG